MMHSTRVVLFALLLAAALSASAAEPAPPALSLTDSSGAAVKVPPADRPALLLFAMAGQAQSRDAIRQAVASLGDAGAVEAMVILSGPQAAEQARLLAGEKLWAGRVVADPDYAASGRWSVRVWPTAVVLDKDGRELAHLAGVPKTLAHDLDACLAHAAGRIDRAALDQRLKSHGIVADSPDQVAARHLQVAQRLLDKQLVEQAKAELSAALRVEPRDAALKLSAAAMLLSVGSAGESLAILDRVEEGAAPAWRLKSLRGRALVALGRWEQAGATLREAVKLNPDPAEAWYELGLVYEHQSDWPRAAEAFRKAFQTTPAGRRLAASGPATQPVRPSANP